jgi:hypothetical protein
MAGGFVILMPDEGTQPSAATVDERLQMEGWRRWDGHGLPAFAVFHCLGPKGDYFEAGYWGGAGVPVFFLGGGGRAYKRKQIVNRFAGWAVIGDNGQADVGQLVEAIKRKELVPPT